MPQPVSPEFKLLCSLLPVHFRGAMPWPSDWAGVDPAAFFAYVLKTQVAPLALHHWETKCPALWDATPFEVRARIIAWQELFVERQNKLFVRWQELLQIFEKKDIPAIPLKGFERSISLYQNPFRRLFSDFDFLIRKNDVPNLGKILSENGFHQFRPINEYFDYESSWSRIDKNSNLNLNLDIHWALRPDWYFIWLPNDELWESVSINTNGNKWKYSLNLLNAIYYAVVSNVNDFGHGNLRGCVEALEYLAMTDSDNAQGVLELFKKGKLERVLRVLEVIREHFFTDSQRPSVLSDFSNRRYISAFCFRREDFYLSRCRHYIYRSVLQLLQTGQPLRLIGFCLPRIRVFYYDYFKSVGGFKISNLKM